MALPGKREIKIVTHIKTFVDKCGFPSFSVAMLGRKAVETHHPVLNAFRGACPDGKTGDHLTRDRSDNRYHALDWATKEEQDANRAIFDLLGDYNSLEFRSPFVADSSILANYSCDGHIYRVNTLTLVIYPRYFCK